MGIVVVDGHGDPGAPIHQAVLTNGGHTEGGSGHSRPGLQSGHLAELKSHPTPGEAGKGQAGGDRDEQQPEKDFHPHKE